MKKHEDVYVEGTRHTANYLIESGLIRTFYGAPTGEELTLGYWLAGDMIGGPYFFDDTGVHVWSARAVQDSSFLVITGRDLRMLVMQVPRIAEVMLDFIAFKLLWDALLLQTLRLHPVSSRLAHLLMKLTVLYGETDQRATTIRHRFTQEDLANMIGSTRQWVNAQLRQFQRDGVLQLRNRYFVITDLDRLKKLSKS